MRSTFRFGLLFSWAAAIAGAATIGVLADMPPDAANQINVTFSETPAVITDHVADFGIRQLILTSSWTFDGFGPVTDVTSVTQDTAVHPCGPGSSSESATRRIVAGAGTLVLREGGIQCLTTSGPVFTGTYVVDGDASTGIFAGADGSGTVTVRIAIPPLPGTTNLSGRLKLAESSNA
jgi:hypothetical protein